MVPSILKLLRFPTKAPRTPTFQEACVHLHIHPDPGSLPQGSPTPVWETRAWEKSISTSPSSVKCHNHDIYKFTCCRKGRQSNRRIVTLGFKCWQKPWNKEVQPDRYLSQWVSGVADSSTCTKLSTLVKRCTDGLRSNQAKDQKVTEQWIWRGPWWWDSPQIVFLHNTPDCHFHTPRLGNLCLTNSLGKDYFEMAQNMPHTTTYTWFSSCPLELQGELGGSGGRSMALDQVLILSSVGWECVGP